MLTDVSNTRSSNLYLTVALTAIIVLFLIFAAAPAISLGEPAPVAAPGVSETGSDYYQRHPDLRISAALATYIASDFYLRHPEWASNVQHAAIPVTGNSEASDYFIRHPELIELAATPLDECFDVSIGELAACRSVGQSPTLAPGLACESPVDCR